ncbi:conserved Plasmodium protein, unknown function [Plasmodium ovale curtisi]|uniref:Uncharacterized protein n=1 Tax=Plasmodium ovale curtisi TaxID=864141 RepID=A0A1A8WAR9_PLAOA|nr:conserved Plasmodium protein, unknown function [Plasmodium ovale curtisi]
MKDPLELMSQHLRNLANFSKHKKKKKKVLVKKLNSHNIKIKDVINKNFIQKGIKDIYEHVRRNKDNILFFEEFTELLNLIKVVFDVENVYIGKIYKWKKKKKKKNILQFVYTNENCDLKGKKIILNEKEFNLVFTKFFPNEGRNFLFEKNYLFPNIVKEDFIYDEINENLFLNVNPFFNNKNCLSRLQKSLYTPPWGYNKEDNLMGHSHHGNHTKKQIDFNSNSLETSTTEGMSDGDEARSKGEYTETGDDDGDSSENSHGEYGNINATDGNTAIADCNIDAAYGDNEPDGDEGDCFKGYLLEALHMNLTYKCVYIYEVMEREVSFFHPYMKPGDFLFIPIIYNTCYNFNLLNKLYLRKRKLLLHTFDEEIEDNARNTNEEEINSLSSPKDTDAHECNKEETQRESTLEREKKVHMCLCVDNRGSVAKISKSHICSLVHLSYFLITRMIMCERKCVEEQVGRENVVGQSVHRRQYTYGYIGAAVNYMLDCECGGEKQSIEKLRSKMKEANYERVINKFKGSLSHHLYYDKSDELTKHMTTLLWVEKKILKHQHKIVEIGKVKVECNRHFSRTLLSCLVILDYDHTRFSLSSDLLRDYDWGKLIACANGQFIDKLTSFNALTAFAEKGADRLRVTLELLNKLAAETSAWYPRGMERITTYGITLLDYFNEVAKVEPKVRASQQKEQRHVHFVCTGVHKNVRAYAYIYVLDCAAGTLPGCNEHIEQSAQNKRRRVYQCVVMEEIGDRSFNTNYGMMP